MLIVPVIFQLLTAQEKDASVLVISLSESASEDEGPTTFSYALLDPVNVEVQEVQVHSCTCILSPFTFISSVLVLVLNTWCVLI